MKSRAKSQKSEKPFVTTAAHKKNVTAHTKMVTAAAKQLRAQGIAAKEKRRLEFFFATNTQRKAQALVDVLHLHGCNVVLVGSGKKFMVTGIAPARAMSLPSLREWANDMVTLGFEFDSLFDGWNVSLV